MELVDRKIKSHIMPLLTHTAVLLSCKHSQRWPTFSGECAKQWLAWACKGGVEPFATEQMAFADPLHDSLYGKAFYKQLARTEGRIVDWRCFVLLPPKWESKEKHVTITQWSEVATFCYLLNRGRKVASGDFISNELLSCASIFFLSKFSFNNTSLLLKKNKATEWNKSQFLPVWVLPIVCILSKSRYRSIYPRLLLSERVLLFITRTICFWVVL